MFLWSYAKHYEGDRHWRRDGYVEYLYPPYAFHLSSTPLNESLAAMADRKLVMKDGIIVS